jgi:hypothetical protein
MIGYVIVAIIVIILTCINTSYQDDYLCGMWVADDDFCESSGVSSLMLYMGAGHRDCLRYRRECYLVIMDDLCNQGFTLNYTRGWAGPMCREYKIYGQAAFDDEQIWTEDIVITSDMSAGKLIIKSAIDDTIYARLYKLNDV